MSIKNDGQVVNVNQRPQTENVNQSQPQSQPNNNFNNSFNGIFNTFGIFNYNSHIDDASELADALMTNLSTYLKSPEIAQLLGNKVDFRIFPIHKNNQNFGIHYSVIIFAAIMKGASNKAYYHGIILEKSNEDPAPSRQNYGGVMVEKIYTASDIYKHDPSFIGKIDGYLKSVLPNNQLIRLGFEVLPRHLKYTNDDNTFNQDALNRITLNAQKPLILKGVFRELGINPPSINTYINPNSNEVLTLDLSFNNLETETTKDIYNNPIRDDLKQTLYKESNDKTKSVYDNKTKSVISETTAFITTDIINAKTNNLFVNPYQTQQVPIFGARVVITKPSNAFLDSLEGLLLSIYLSTSLGKNNRWFQAFKPSHTAGKDLRNVGALNIEQNLENSKGSAFDENITVGDIFSRSEMDTIFPVFMSNAFSPNLSYAIDVGNCQYNSWLLEIFEACAGNYQDAILSIVEAANALTNGAMSNFFKGNNVVIPRAENILMGHYHTKNGQLRDIRDVDYIYLANYVSQQDGKFIRISDHDSYQLLIDWTQSINDLNTDPVIRLDAQSRIIRKVLGNENVKITGTAQRFTFTSDFISALIRAVEASNVPISLSNDYYIHGNAVRSTFNQFNEAAVNIGANVNYNAGNIYNPNNGNQFANYSAF